MSRSGYFAQVCACGSDRRAVASVTLSASSLHVTPRKKSKAQTVYICADCLENPSRRTRARFIRTLLETAIEASS
jgi:hypothetical protein